MKRRFLVDLDCLLDTRVGILSMINPEYRLKILSGQTAYFSRVMDDYEYLGEGIADEFKRLWDTRSDPRILAASFKTLLVPHLVQLFISILMSAHEHPQWNGIAVEINTHPYDLDQEQLDLFQAVLGYALTGNENQDDDHPLELDITMVNIPLEDLTIDRLGRDWEAVYLYDFVKWTNYRSKDMDGQEMKAVNTELHVPALFREMPNRKTLRMADGSHINPFHETKRNFALWINVNFVNPQLYSIPNPDQFIPPNKNKK